RQRGKLERGVAEMAHDLGERDWCHSERITLADISLASCLGWLAFRLPELDWRGMYANLARHYDKLSQRPAFAETAPK
ncbi:MAG: glutathione S-transferase C-terminal domain-containing protein, partial [Burkholderiales bacterium]